MKPRWFRTLLWRRIIIIVLIVLQVFLLVHMISRQSQASKIVSTILTALSLVVALYIVSKRDKGAYKLTWVFVILLFPLFGGALYLLFSFQSSTRRFAKRNQIAMQKAIPLFSLPGDGYESASREIPDCLPQVRYLQHFAHFPVYMNTETQYFSPGEAFFEALLPELEKAEKYIFLEYFIVQQGVMWDAVLEVLKRKVQQGVKVRLMYDDIGSFFLLPQDYARTMEALGIECAVFNPFRPVMSAVQNNRDHRKIAAIDGKVAFTGGINLADEYINAIEKHGHWKDSGIMVKGKAAWSFTLMFLEMWSLCANEDEDFAAYFPWSEEECTIPSNGFVQPYADSPMDRENVGEHVYLQIINRARNYLYINTPYLIVDDSMLSALCLAAKSGVDVRIVTPRIWDKWFVHMTTRSYYRDLTKAGVKIYEYTNGFIHAKSFVADDKVATVGTTNLDFRSLYLHFECGVWMHGTNAVLQIKQDFLQTLETCHRITEDDFDQNIFLRIFQDIMRLFAPLM